MTIRAILIDDEQNNIDNLSTILSTYCPQISIIATTSNAIEGVDLLKQHSPDLLFLDIEMPFADGFQVLEAIPKIDFAVIFVTAYHQYAIKAIKFCALDYLLKPIDVFELKKAVEKVEQSLIERKENEQVQILLENRKENQQTRKIALPHSSTVEFISIDTIIRCKGENNYTNFYLQEGREVLVSRTLKEYEELLSEFGFIRCHQSHLINMHHVRQLVKSDGGYLVLSNQEKIPISRQKKEWVHQQLQGFSL